MAIRVRPTRNQEEYAAALGGIGHYFGGGWTPEEKEEFARLLPHERMHAPSTATRSSAVPASSRSSSRFPAGSFPAQA